MSSALVQQQHPPSAAMPFLKWAGGKRWLVERHWNLFPGCSGRYIEPFLGGGSVFFRMQPRKAILADSNDRLIECYTQIRENPDAIFDLMQLHQSAHCDEHYYRVRSEKITNPVQRAAQFLYLNRTCWNGLYRVNLKGEFNVPRGTKDKVAVDKEELSKVSAALQNCTLVAADFEETIDQAAEGDLVFIDPPYTVKHNFNGFVKYNNNIFKWADQIRLRDAVSRAADRGAISVITNAAHKSVIDLYSDLGEQHILSRQSVLAGKSTARGSYQELFVVVHPS